MAMPAPRRFPPPWSVEDIGAAFVVKDGAGRKLVTIRFPVTPVTAPIEDHELNQYRN